MLETIIVIVIVIAIVVGGFALFLHVCGKVGEAIGTILFAPRMLKLQQETIAHNQYMANLELQYRILEQQLNQQEVK